MDWSGFQEWLESQDYADRTVNDRLNYAKRFSKCLSKGDLSELKTVSNGVRNHALKGLAALSKFLGIYDSFLALKRNYGLKWSGKTADELVIDRLTKVQDEDEMFEWIRQVKTVQPELADFMDLIAYSGLRFIEAIHSYNLIIDLAAQGRLDDYYDSETETLEHYKFKDRFIRKRKKAFVSFIPGDLVKRVSEHETISSNAIQKRIQRADLHSRFGDVREAHGSYLTKYLRQAEIDFLHGRVSASVFMKNYFNPSLIGDLQDRMLEAVKGIAEKIS